MEVVDILDLRGIRGPAVAIANFDDRRKRCVVGRHNGMTTTRHVRGEGGGRAVIVVLLVSDRCRDGRLIEVQ